MKVFKLHIIFKSSQDLKVLCLTLRTYYSYERLSGISICTWRVEFKDAEFASWVLFNLYEWKIGKVCA